jgi:predicted RNA-binding Zn ribbon-like protein
MTQPAEPVDLAVALVNTYDLLNDPPDGLRDDATARRFLDRHGYPADAAALGGVDELRAGRDRLRAFFHAEPGLAAAGVLNELLADTGAVTRLEAAADGWRVTAGPAEPGVRRIVAVAAAGLAAFVAERGFARIGTCAGAPCDCAFVDRTRPGTRRYCCTYCADRVAAADYRRRKRAAT